jgi:NAD(P)-dependent dehydrogenase (short-subunit alcohol dehydrogenase family)
VIADVRDRAAVTAAVDEAAARFGRIDLAVTAAGYYEDGIDVADISHGQWDRMLAVILGGTVNTFAVVYDLLTLLAVTAEPPVPREGQPARPVPRSEQG